MKKTLFILLLLMVRLGISAQTPVIGIVVDEQGEPLPGVIIRHCDAKTFKYVSHASSDADGKFSIRASKENLLVFSLFGYQKDTIKVASLETPTRVVLRESAVALKEVTVKATKVKERGDTVSYLVGAYANANDRSIGDVLAKMPGFDVDKSSGRISYEGKPISNFYIEGLDMLDKKYGIATNTLPQGDVATVEVMRNHQPIRVLDDFTFSNNAAVNLRMKDKAKSHWIGTASGGLGESADGLLWKFEGLALRIKSDWQTMFSYKTNNTGLNLTKESAFLIDDSENCGFPALTDFISLSSPAASSLSQDRYLKNRSHAATINLLKRIDDASQLTFQLTYDNFFNKAHGSRRTEYLLANGTHRVIDNIKDWRNTQNILSGSLKYEHNSEKSYLKNTLSTNLLWEKQTLDETGSHPHYQQANVPEFEVKDNVYLIRRFGKHLVSFYSNNVFRQNPQHLTVDSLRQNVRQRFFATDTYLTGGLKIKKLSLSLRMGIKAMTNHLTASAVGVPDSLGVLNEQSHFTAAMLYVRPSMEYVSHGLTWSLAVPFEQTYYKYSEEDGVNKFSVSPTAGLRWEVTPRLSMGLYGNISTSPIDYNRFHESIILQDYLNITRGYLGYERETSKSVRYSISYRNALKGTHALLSVQRSFNTNPYTLSRDFLGDYVVAGTVDASSKSKGWTANAFLTQTLGFWGSKLSFRTIYMHNDSYLMQNEELLPSAFSSLNTSLTLNTSPWKDMSVSYSARFDRYSSSSQDTRTAFNSWHHVLNVTIPIKQFKVQLVEELNNNQISSDTYKHTFFSDIILGFKGKHLDYELKASNLLNNETYAYSVAGNLMSYTSSSEIRGREILLTVYLKR